MGYTRYAAGLDRNARIINANPEEVIPDTWRNQMRTMYITIGIVPQRFEIVLNSRIRIKDKNFEQTVTNSV